MAGVLCASAVGLLLATRLMPAVLVTCQNTVLTVKETGHAVSKSFVNNFVG